MANSRKVQLHLKENTNRTYTNAKYEEIETKKVKFLGQLTESSISFELSVKGTNSELRDFLQSFGSQGKTKDLINLSLSSVRTQKDIDEYFKQEEPEDLDEHVESFGGITEDELDNE